MASYDAQINILVAGQRNINNLLGKLNQVEDAITQIESRWKTASAALQRADIRLGVTGRRQPRGEGGRLAKDPDRQARFNAFAARRSAAQDLIVSRGALRIEAQRGAIIKDQIDGNEKLLRQTERRITLEQRLNSAVELFQTRQQKFARGGGGRGLSRGLQEQASSIKNAFEAAGGGASRNLRLINSLATGLGRIVERQNEFNRSQALGSKGFEAGRRLQERITAASSAARLPRQKVAATRSLATEAIAASRSGDQSAYSEALRKATAATSRLERESRELAKSINEQEREISRIAKLGPRSPVLGGVNFPGSPRALEAQRKQREQALRQAQQGYPASPVLGAATMVGSPKALQAQQRAQAAADRALRAQERAAKIAEGAASKALSEAQKGYPASPILGSATMAGSPRALQAQERNRAAVERRMATQRRADERAAKLQQQAAAAVKRAADKALKEAQEGYPSSPILGGASMGGSPRWKTAQESARRKVEAAARATERAADKAIADAQKGYPASPILGSTTMVGSPRALQAQERSRMATDRALRAQAKVAKAAESAADKALSEAQKGYPASPILGTAAMAGSPRAIQAQARARAAADRALLSQARAAKAAQSAANKALSEAQKGYPSSPILGTTATTGSPRWKAAQQAAEKKLDAATKAMGAAADKALAEAQKGYPSSPILGGVKMPGSPIFKQTPFLERQFGKKGSAAISEGLIGGAFPLLFGQGIGASAGGLIGGATGGFAGGGLGFGLSLIGTALGTVFDTLNQAAQDTGKAFNYPIEGFEKLKAAGLFASRQQEYYISKLIETGQTSKATAEIQAEMIKKIGVSGVNDLMELGDASSRLGKAWAEFNLQLQAALAGPMAGLLEWIASVVELSTGNVQREAQSIDPQAFARAQEEANRVAQQGKPFFSDQDRAAYEKELNRLSRKIIAETGVPLVKGTKQDPAQQEAALRAQRQVADQIKSAYREGFQLQQRAIDLELKTADIRRRIENEIFSKQQELLQQQVDNDRKRAQVAIEAVDLEYRKRIANEEGRAAEVLAAEAELFKTRAQGEAEIATAKKLLELDIAKRQREAQDYVYSLGREVDSIRRETLGLEMEVADYRLKIEREIENERLTAAAAERAGATTATAERTKGGAAASVPDLNAGMTGTNWPAGVPRPGSSAAAVGFTSAQLQAATAAASKFNGIANQCSESVKAFYGSLGITLPGVTAWADTVRKAGKTMTDWSQLKSGDIVATGRPGDTPHVGVYTGGKNVFHQSRSRGLRAGNYPDLGYFQQGGYFVRPTAMGNAPTSTAAQLEQARSQIRRPLITPVPVDAAVGARAALDAGDTRLKEGAIALDQKLAQLQEEKARQGLYEVARGPIEIKQRQEIVNLAKAELAVIGPMSQSKQEAVLFETQALEILKNRQATDSEILKITKRQGKERQELEQALADGLANTQKQIELDREALKLAQERRFVEEKAGLTQQLAVTGAAEEAGFFGAGASAYTSELTRSGNAAQATEIAQQTRALEVKQAIANIRGELNGLVDSTNVGIRAAEGIGSAFGQAFQGLISGSASAQEALSSFFKSVAESFLSMAAEIIAKQMTMIVLQTILKALGAVAGASGGGGGTSGGAGVDPGTFNIGPAGQIPGLVMAANGATFANGVAQFARGGTFTNSIVSSPTLFQFADGGVTRMGEMGEAGPEAIMPLKRGPDGRLGVDASGMAVPYRRPAAAAATPEMEVPYQRGGSALAVPYLKSEGNAVDDSMNATIDVKFETVRIGGVDYVTRDEAEQIGRESAQRGADLAHKRYRNSPSARRAAGMS